MWHPIRRGQSLEWAKCANTLSAGSQKFPLNAPGSIRSPSALARPTSHPCHISNCGCCVLVGHYRISPERPHPNPCVASESLPCVSSRQLFPRWRSVQLPRLGVLFPARQRPPALLSNMPEPSLYSLRVGLSAYAGPSLSCALIPVRGGRQHICTGPAGP